MGMVVDAVEAYLLTTLVGGVSSGSVFEDGVWTTGEDRLTTVVERGTARVGTVSIAAGTPTASSAKRERLTLGSSGTETLPFEAELIRA